MRGMGTVVCCSATLAEPASTGKSVNSEINIKTNTEEAICSEDHELLLACLLCVMEELDRLEPNKLRHIIKSLIEVFGDRAVAVVHNKLDMFRRCWLLEVPQDIVSHILSNWLYQKDLCKLDTAFCAHALRSTFLQWCALNATVSSQESVPRRVNRSYLHWLVLRRLKSAIVFLNVYNTESVGDELMTYLQVTGSALEDLHMGKNTMCAGPTMHHIFALCPNLVRLSAESCLFDDETLLRLFSTLKGLRFLDVSRFLVEFPESIFLVEESTRWTGICGDTIACSELEELRANYDPYITDDKIFSIAQSCTKLKVLRLSHTTALTSEGLARVAQHCRRLEELHLDHSAAGDEVALALAKNCPGLRVFSACRATTAASDTSVVTLFSSCHQLTHVNLSHNQRITDACLRDLHVHCPALRRLTLSGCTGLTPEGVLGVIRTCAVLENLDIRDFPADFDQVVRRELFEKKLWLGPWQDRNLKIQQTSKV